MSDEHTYVIQSALNELLAEVGPSLSQRNLVGAPTIAALRTAGWNCGALGYTRELPLFLQPGAFTPSTARHGIELLGFYHLALLLLDEAVKAPVVEALGHPGEDPMVPLAEFYADVMPDHAVGSDGGSSVYLELARLGGPIVPSYSARLYAIAHQTLLGREPALDAIARMEPIIFYGVAANVHNQMFDEELRKALSASSA